MHKLIAGYVSHRFGYRAHLCPGDHQGQDISAEAAQRDQAGRERGSEVENNWYEDVHK